MTRRLKTTVILVCSGAAIAALIGQPIRAQTPISAASLPPVQGPAATPDLLLDQGKRLFDSFDYDQAVPIFDQLIAMLLSSGQLARPDLAAQAYERRGRARFALGNTTGAEQDFSALLVINPAFQLDPSVSPRVIAVFESVRKLTIGQLTLSIVPAGEVQIGGRAFTVSSEPQPINLPAGEHEVMVTRPSYRPLSMTVMVTAGAATPLALTLERVSATLEVISIPGGVDVIINGDVRGKTAPATGSPESPGQLHLTDLAPGVHRLVLRRECYADVERTISIDQPADLRTETLRLTPAIASVAIQAAPPGSDVLIDGVLRGQTPASLTVCEGAHTIEVRGATGRFVDRRAWKTGDAVTLDARLRHAFPIVAASGGPGLTADQARGAVERALGAADRFIVYAPNDAELDAAIRAEAVPADWLSTSSVPKLVRRDLGRRLATRLQTHGVAAVTVGPDPFVVSVTLLAAGSGEPDVITLDTADPASMTAAAARLGTALPPLLRPSLDASVVDLAGTPGAAVVRVAGVAAQAGLAVGDVIVATADGPVTSVAELRQRLAADRASGGDLALTVRNLAGQTRTVTVAIALAPGIIPLEEVGLLNGALIELEQAVRRASSPIEQASARVNLARVEMRLGNWEEALAHLRQAQLPDGVGVSAGTVAYWTGLCHEALGRTADARVAFTAASEAPEARLAIGGPLVAPLARQKLQSAR